VIDGEPSRSAKKGGDGPGGHRRYTTIRARCVWDASGAVEDDAQVIAYIDTTASRNYVSNNVDAAMPTLDDREIVKRPHDQACNASIRRHALKFSTAPGQRARTPGGSRDVGFHEYGTGCIAPRSHGCRQLRRRR